MDVGIELFERVARAGGRLLRAEQLAPAGRGGDSVCAPGYLLTFDVGRILLVAEPASATLRASEVRDRAELGASLRSLDEEEPWWRLLGNPITRVWPGPSGSGAIAGSQEEVKDMRIQFRQDDENPRVVSLRFDAGAVRVTLEQVSHGR